MIILSSSLCNSLVILLIIHHEITQSKAGLRPPLVLLGSVDSPQHGRLCEALQETAATLGVSPHSVQWLWTRTVSHLVIAKANIADWVQLAKVSYQYHGNVSEEAILRVHLLARKARSLCLLHAQMHAEEEPSADERNFVDNEELDVLPLLLERAIIITLQFLLEAFMLRVELKSRARCLGTKPNVECSNASVSSEFDSCIDLLLLEEPPEMYKRSA